MPTRRKVLATAAASAVLPIAAMATPNVPAVDEGSAEFIRLQKWFREHPHLLWAQPIHTKVEEIALRAQQLAQPFISEHVRADVDFSLDAWVDRITNNVLLTGYVRFGVDHTLSQPPKTASPEFSCACAITRKDIRALEADRLDEIIKEQWQGICAVLTGDKVPTQYRLSPGVLRQISTLQEYKLPSGVLRGV